VDCSEVIEQLAEFLDEDAREEICRTIEEHLSQCRDCRFKVDTVRKTIVLYQADNKPIDLPVKVSDQLKIALDQAYGR
jgi:predicted anti-sigma-YlaC factor YlaD